MLSNGRYQEKWCYSGWVTSYRRTVTCSTMANRSRSTNPLSPESLCLLIDTQEKSFTRGRLVSPVFLPLSPSRVQLIGRETTKTVKQGEMRAVVHATGPNTFFGKAAKLVQRAQKGSHIAVILKVVISPHSWTTHPAGLIPIYVRTYVRT